MSSSQETACHVIMYLNVELELALVAIQKYLAYPSMTIDYLGPNTKKQWLQYIHIQFIVCHSKNRCYKIHDYLGKIKEISTFVCFIIYLTYINLNQKFKAT